MDDSLLVSSCKSFSYLDGNIDGFFEFQRTMGDLLNRGLPAALIMDLRSGRAALGSSARPRTVSTAWNW